MTVMSEEVVAEDEDKQQCLRGILEKYVFDQSHRPKRGELVSYLDVDFEDWLRVKIISSYKQTSKHRLFQYQVCGYRQRG